MIVLRFLYKTGLISFVIAAVLDNVLADICCQGRGRTPDPIRILQPSKGILTARN